MTDDLELHIRTCQCSGLLVRMKRPWINDFGYLCAECGRVYQAQRVEFYGPRYPWLQRGQTA